MTAAKPVVVLLHSIGTDRTLWSRLTELLGDRYTIVAPDSRGHGADDRTAPIDRERWVEDVAEVITAHADADVHLVGLSMGGVQALGTALADGTRIASLTLANTFAGLDPAFARAKVDGMRRDIEESGMAAYATAYLDSTLVADVDAADYDALHRAIAGVEPAAYVASAEATFTADYTGALGGIDVPTLVITSEHDAKTPRPLSEQIAAGIRGAELVSIPHAGHLSVVENPERFASELDAFITRVQAGGTA